MAAMLKFKLAEETRFGILFFLSILAVSIIMFILNFFIGGESTSFVEKEKEKTVIVTQANENAAKQIPPPKAVVSSVREAIKQGKHSTSYLQISNISKTSPEYEELRKQLAEENQKHKAPKIRKEAGASPTAPIRYLDESTPRDRTSDAMYMYFVDVAGTLSPRFCIQHSSKHQLGITGFTITADAKHIDIVASPLKFENTATGVAEWYDVPLDRHAYEVVQAIIKAKKVTLTINSPNGTKTREVADKEIKGMRNILDGYRALGGSLDYLQTGTAVPAKRQKK
jgi:hypothetical protein